MSDKPEKLSPQNDPDQPGPQLAAVRKELRQTKGQLAEIQTQHSLLTTCVQAITGIADELTSCRDVDSLCRRAVELAREKLHLERCGIHLLRDGELHGTWGTDLDGETTDEHDFITPNDRFVDYTLEDAVERGTNWFCFGPTVYTEKRGSQRRQIELEWFAATRICTGDKELGTLFYDSAVTHTPFDRERQEVISIFCTYLGELIQHKQTETRLQDQVQLFQSLMTAIPNRVFHKDLEGRYLGCNETFSRELEMRPEDVIGQTAFDLLPPDKAAQHARTDAEVIEQETTLSYEIPTVLPDGQDHITIVNKAPYRDADGNVTGVVGVITDITEQKQQEHALYESEKRHRQQSEYLHTIIGLADQLLRCNTADDLCRRTVEICLNRLNTERCGIFLCADDNKEAYGTWGTDRHGNIVDEHKAVWPLDDFHDILANQPKDAGSRWHIHRDADQRDWRDGQFHVFGRGWVGIIPIRTERRLIGIFVIDKAISGEDPDTLQLDMLEVLVSLLANLIERRRVQQSRDEEHHLLRTLIDNMPDLIYAKDCDSRFTLNNRAHLEFLGITEQSEAIGKTDRDFFPKAKADRFYADEQKVLAEDRAMVNCEETVVDRDGRQRILLSTKVPIHNMAGEVTGLVGITRDVTEFTELETQLRQAEKMEAIGQLAGGIAHDFNNQLAAILGFADILTYELEDNEEMRHYAQLIVSASKRSADLTKQLLAFARKGKYRTETVSIHETIREVLALLERSIDKRIRIRTAYDANPDTVTGDPTQLQGALLNVALNARDALPDGGKLTFSTTRVDLSKELAENLAGDVPSGKYIRIDIQDTGVGMDAHTQQHLFEPFFTTKPAGSGTGMGLASVYGTVKNHNGGIAVHSAVGKGTTFRIYLPAGKSARTPSEAAEKPSHPPVQGSASILVIDDEDVVCRVARRMLTKLGYSVQTFTDPEKALAFYQESWSTIDLVIFDMVMPTFSGRETYRALKKINPDIQAILASGYTVDEEAEEILAEGVNAFVNKPFMLNELSELVDKVVSS